MTTLEYYSPDPHSENSANQLGHWYAHACDGDYDASGPTPELALARLCNTLETELEKLLDTVRYGPK